MIGTRSAPAVGVVVTRRVFGKLEVDRTCSGRITFFLLTADLKPKDLLEPVDQQE